jgi:hypothetical protein
MSRRQEILFGGNNRLIQTSDAAHINDVPVTHLL